MRSIKLTVSVAVAALTLGTVATPALANRPATAGPPADRSANAQPNDERAAPGSRGAERSAEARDRGSDGDAPDARPPAAAGGNGGPAGSGQPPTYVIDQGQVDRLVITVDGAASTAGLEVDTVSGEIAGAAYVGQKPADWNGELVVWAHGFRGEGPSLTVDPAPEFLHLLENGYAWIASSYRRNSYDPGIGVLDTKNVTVRAAELFGQPERTYLAGASMGGHVTAAAIERFPQLYDGALPVCGVMADVDLFDYFLDYNLGAAAIAGLDAADLTYPDDDWVNDEVVAIKQALSTLPVDPESPAPWAFGGSPLVEGFSTLTEAGERLKDLLELASGGERGVIYEVAWDYWHLASNGDFFFDLGEGDGTIANRSGIVAQNADRNYGERYGEAFADLDNTILRVEASNRVRKSQGHKPAPLINGTPTIPVLTMHTIGDLFVPLQMQITYAERVAANGLSDNLVQRTIRDVGHCTFTPPEFQQAYDDLFLWVQEGDRPEGENLLDGVDDALLGCDWTITPDVELPGGFLRVFPCPPALAADG